MSLLCSSSCTFFLSDSNSCGWTGDSLDPASSVVCSRYHQFDDLLQKDRHPDVPILSLIEDGPVSDPVLERLLFHMSFYFDAIHCRLDSIEKLLGVLK